MSSKMWKLTLASTVLTIVISYETYASTTTNGNTETSTMTSHSESIIAAISSTILTSTATPLESSTTAAASTTNEMPTTTSLISTLLTSGYSYTTSSLHSTSTAGTSTMSQSPIINTSQLSTGSITTSNSDNSGHSKQNSSESPTTPREYNQTSSTAQTTGLSLEEKQKRNGITSAVICVGSLILIGIAYLSSFVDRPTEKVPRMVRDQIDQKSRYKYDSEGRIVRHNNNEVNHAGGKKISFGDASQISGEERPGTSRDTKMIEMTHVKPTIYSSDGEKQTANVSGENRKRGKGIGQSGWDILANNPKFFDDYQPHHTNTNGIENE